MPSALLKRSYDRKVSPYSSGKPNDLRPKVGNSFGISAVDSCPGATATCKAVCYAVKLERAWSSVGNQMSHNLTVLREARTAAKMAKLLHDMMGDFRKEVMHQRDRLGIDLPLAFRIHWDGDFYSVTYAKAWRTVIEANPDIQFWAYTRSFTPRCNVVPTLMGLDNLALYLSVDNDNNELARKVAEQYGVAMAMLASTFDEAREFAGEAPAAKCPENAKRIPLVADNGEGACIACGMCVVGRKNVLFSSTHK